MKNFKSFREEYLEEKNKPTSPEKWAKAKAAAKSKFAVYPSAYANAWASKKYKSMGGGWRSTKEEVEQIDELKMSTIDSYFRKRRDDYHGSKVGGKKKGKEVSAKNVKTARSRLMGFKPTSEETYADAKAATPSVMSPGEGISEKMTTAKRIMALKKKMVKEDLYDHEKEDKSVKTYGKKPKFDKADKDDSLGEKKPQAAAVLSGGTTLTGSKRDTIEIDPMMRNRPGQPDVTKKDDKDKEKKKDK